MRKHQWQNHFAKGFQDLVDEAEPNLTYDEFKKTVTQYLSDQTFRYNYDTLLPALFKKTYLCLQRLAALRQIHPVVESADWVETRKIISKLGGRKEIPKLLIWLKNQRKESMPLAASVVDYWSERFEGLKAELELADRLAGNDEELVAGYMQPPFETQFMLHLDHYLKRKLPKGVSAEHRRLLVGACALAATFFPASAAEDDIQRRISSRIERAERSEKKESVKWRWSDQELSQ